MSIALASLTAGAFAQDQEGDRGNRGGDRGNERGERGGERRNFDPAQMQQRMLQGIKEQMKAPDDEWAVIEPKLQKVMTAQREARAGGGMMGGRGRGGDRQGDQQPTSELGRASRELRDLLQQENASPDQINAKLAAYRSARDKAQAELKSARDSLQEILTERQEAVLVAMGVLE